MVAPVAMHEMDEAGLRAVIANCVEALEQGGVDNPAEIRTLEQGAPVEQLGLMLDRDHARWLLRKHAAERSGE